jgi:hypothetical protein
VPLASTENGSIAEGRVGEGGGGVRTARMCAYLGSESDSSCILFHTGSLQDRGK